MSILDDAREGMDHDVRPQDDLFGHVNGRWLAETEIPSDRSSWGPFVQLADVAEEQVARIIEDLAAKARDATEGDLDADAQKIGDLFASFMDTERIDRLGTRPIKPLVDAVAALRDPRDVAAFLGEFERLGGHGLFGSYVNTDDRDSDRYLFHLVQGGLGLPDESYYRDEKFAPSARRTSPTSPPILRLVDDQVEGGDPEAGAQTVLRIDTRLAEGHWERAETRDVQKTYNLMTVAELRELCPGFDWDVYTTNLSASAHEADELLFEVCVRQPSYFEHLSTVLGEVPIEDWRTWLLTHVVRSAAPYLTDDVRRGQLRLLRPHPQRHPRAARALEARRRPGRGRAGRGRRRGVRRAALPAELQAADGRARRQPARGVPQLDQPARLDDRGDQDPRLRQARTFRPKIGYPEKFRDYSGLSVRPDDLLGNVAASAAFETDRQLDKIGAPVDRDEWFMLPQTVNAYYNPGTNEICFPAGILQKPFFSPDAEPAENYGGIGAVIGHEIGHGFDDQGAQYDGAGNLNDWWTPDDKAAFEVKSKALIEQYDGFAPRDLPDEHVNGSLTVGENIGDLGGLTIGHRAYLISTDGAAAPEDRQKLFMNWAYCWRTKRRIEQAQQYLTIDPHSPPEFRANIVRNLDEFHEVFGTAEGDGLWLDPEQRVRIW